tara:strand:+ start:991 stop:1215 length:225 start_codon:yes stop_codon:yes gene_type:complete
MMRVTALIQVTYEIVETSIFFEDFTTGDDEFSEYKMVKYFQENGKVVDEKIIVDDNGNCFHEDNNIKNEEDDDE